MLDVLAARRYLHAAGAPGPMKLPPKESTMQPTRTDTLPGRTSVRVHASAWDRARTEAMAGTIDGIRRYVEAAVGLGLNGAEIADDLADMNPGLGDFSVSLVPGCHGTSAHVRISAA